MSALRHLAGRVWIYPHDPDPAKVQGCVAVIVDDAGSVLVDAGNGPAVARRVLEAVVTAGLPLPRRLIYTHHHWDHVWGACAWPGLEIVGHRAGARVLRAEAGRPWSEAYVRELAAGDPRLGGHAEDSTVVAVPDSGVLLLGDCFYPPPLHLRQPDDGLDVALLRRLLADHPPSRYPWYVDSHDEPKPATALEGLR